MPVIMILYSCGNSTEKDADSQDIQQTKHPSKADKLKEGAELFSKYGCFICHSLDGSVSGLASRFLHIRQPM
jgi:cytochrome c551/c552